MNVQSTTRRRNTLVLPPSASPPTQQGQSSGRHDAHLLDLARTQWRFGDWQSLAAMTPESLQDHPDRAELVLLASSGHMQLGNFASARELADRAREWGVDANLIARIMAAGVDNSLGRAAAAGGDQARAFRHFESAILLGSPDADTRLTTQARIGEQLRQVGLLGAASCAAGGAAAAKPTWAAENFPYFFSVASDIDGAGCFCHFNTGGKDHYELRAGILAYDLPDKSPLYFVTSSSGDSQKPGRAQFKLRPGFEYKIEGHLEYSGDVPPIFWAFQYRSGVRHASSSVGTGKGKFELRLFVAAETDAVAFGIRLGGKGEINLGKTRLHVVSSSMSIEDAGKRWVADVCRNEYESQTFQRFNERPVEFAFLFRVIATHYPKHVLDVGTGMTALPHMIRNGGALVTAIDNVRDYWPQGMLNRHFHVIDDDITATRHDARYDLISCISVLEHIVKYDLAVESMASLLAEGGLLVITCPYTEGEYVRNVYELPGSSYGQSAPYITQSFSRADVTRWTEACDLELVEQEFWCFWSGDHWTVGQQIVPPMRSTAEQKHQLTCLLFRKKS